MNRELLIALGIVVFGVTIIALALRPKRGSRRHASNADGGSGDIPNIGGRRHDTDVNSDNSIDGGGDGGGGGD